MSSDEEYDNEVAERENDFCSDDDDVEGGLLGDDFEIIEKKPNKSVADSNKPKVAKGSKASTRKTSKSAAVTRSAKGKRPLNNISNDSVAKSPARKRAAKPTKPAGLPKTTGLDTSADELYAKAIQSGRLPEGAVLVEAKPVHDSIVCYATATVVYEASNVVHAQVVPVAAAIRKRKRGGRDREKTDDGNKTARMFTTTIDHNGESHVKPRVVQAHAVHLMAGDYTMAPMIPRDSSCHSMSFVVINGIYHDSAITTTVPGAVYASKDEADLARQQELNTGQYEKFLGLMVKKMLHKTIFYPVSLLNGRANLGAFTTAVDAVVARDEDHRRHYNRKRALHELALVKKHYVQEPMVSAREFAKGKNFNTYGEYLEARSGELRGGEINISKAVGVQFPSLPTENKSFPIKRVMHPVRKQLFIVRVTKGGKKTSSKAPTVADGAALADIIRAGKPVPKKFDEFPVSGDPFENTRKKAASSNK